jgi:hypothetical protein
MTTTITITKLPDEKNPTCNTEAAVIERAERRLGCITVDGTLCIDGPESLTTGDLDAISRYINRNI